MTQRRVSGKLQLGIVKLLATYYFATRIHNAYTRKHKVYVKTDEFFRHFQKKYGIVQKRGIRSHLQKLVTAKLIEIDHVHGYTLPLNWNTDIKYTRHFWKYFENKKSLKDDVNEFIMLSQSFEPKLRFKSNAEKKRFMQSITQIKPDFAKETIDDIFYQYVNMKIEDFWKQYNNGKSTFAQVLPHVINQLKLWKSSILPLLTDTQLTIKERNILSELCKEITERTEPLVELDINSKRMMSEIHKLSKRK